MRAILLIFVMIGIFATVYVLLFYFEITNGAEMSQSLVEQQRQRQGQAVKYIASNIASDVNSVLGRLQDLATVKSRMSASTVSLSSNELQSLYIELFNKTLTDSNGAVDILFEVNRSGIITQWAASPGQQSFLGANVSFRDYVKETASSKAPFYSGMFRGLDGTNRVVITHPILGDPSGIYGKGDSSAAASNSSRNYLGLLAVSIPVKFFERYGNIHDVDKQFLVMLDKNGTQMLTPRTQFIGKSFFGTDFQNFISSNHVYNKLVNTVMSGRPDNGSYSFGKEGGYLNSGFPIFLDMNILKLDSNNSNKSSDRPQYAVFVITPFSNIFSNVDEAVSKDRLHTILLLSVLSLAVAMVFIMFYRWYKDLANKVKQKTSHLTEANQRLQLINEKLLANEKAKEEFISMVSHELRTPLTPIKAFAEMLLKPKYMDQAVLNVKQKKAVTSIVHNIKVLEKLVSDVVDAYRIEMSRLKLSLRSEDVSELVNENISNFSPLTAEKGITFESDMRIDSGTRVYCDPERIGQVLGNLVKNSIDFVAQGGRITVRAEEYVSEEKGEKRNMRESVLDQRIVAKGILETPGLFPTIFHETPHPHFYTGNKSNEKANDPYQSFNQNAGAGQVVPPFQKQQRFVLFTVEDNGVGFPQDHIDHLFQKFYQIDTSLTRKHGGTGLGLVICKGIVEAHGGNIWIDKEYRQGAAVMFTLPATEDTSKKGTSTSTDPIFDRGDAAAQERQRILKQAKLESA